MSARAPLAVAATILFTAAAAAAAGAMCTSTDVRLDREAGPMVAFAPQPPPSPGDRERARSRLHGIRSMLAAYRDLRRVATMNEAQPERDIERWTQAPAGTLIAVGRPDSHDNEHEPRTLLYRRTATGFALAGVQFEARNERSDAALDDILPLSIARWHQVVRHCTAPPGRMWIATVFPFERDDGAVWRTLEFSRYVQIAPYRRERGTKRLRCGTPPVRSSASALHRCGVRGASVARAGRHPRPLRGPALGYRSRPVEIIRG